MRRPRHDGPDTWHHVMNRGIARRTVLETDQDRRFFLSLIAREVRTGRIEVHAFSLMLTHFHLLIRSVTGELSEAMRRIQNRYARWFNRSRRRDGSLFRGRFLSRPIDSLAYRRQVVIYIHDNAVAAGLVSDPLDDEWSSARHHAGGMAPPWLETSWIDSEVAARGAGDAPAERLLAAFPSNVDDDFREWVEGQLNRRLPEEKEDVSLKHAGSPRVVRWAIRKAKLADGTRPFRPISWASRVEQTIQRWRKRVGPLLGLFARKTKDAWTVLRAGLLRILSGCTHREIAMRVSRHSATVCRDVQDHERLMRELPRYNALASQLIHAVLAAR